jgi:hypothetical protein
LLRECVASADFSREQAGAQQRIGETLHFMETLADWAEQMLRLPPATLARVMRLGAKVQQMVRPSAAKKKRSAG